MLSLEPDFNDFHGGDDEDSFSYARAEAGDENPCCGRFAGFFCCENGFIEFKGRKTDCHFWNNTGYNSCKGSQLDSKLVCRGGKYLPGPYIRLRTLPFSLFRNRLGQSSVVLPEFIRLFGPKDEVILLLGVSRADSIAYGPTTS